MDDWVTGNGNPITIDQMLHKITSALKNKSKIFIGTDSDVSKKKVTFCRAICIHGPRTSGFYYVSRHKESHKRYPDLFSRISEEARLSIETADMVCSKLDISKSKIELHLDVSPLENNTKTSVFSDSLKGFIRGVGYDCKLKPNAWASQSVADKHSK